MRYKLLNRICPICQNKSGGILHNLQFTLPKNQNMLPDSYDIVSCQNCGFIFADTSATQDDYFQYYNKCSKYEDKKISSGTGLAAWDILRFEKTASEIEKVIKNKKSAILDVGCANGGLINALKSLDYTNLSAMDPSPKCVSYVRKKYNIEAFCGEISTLKMQLKDKSIRNRFDCLILANVFEHILDLQVTMKNLSLLLKKDGHIYVEVPDASRYIDYFSVPFYYFDCEHINHFDQYSLKNMAIQNNYYQIYCRKNIVEMSKRVKYPVIHGFYRKFSSGKWTKGITPNFKTQNKMIKYIEKSQNAQNYPEIEKLKLSQEKIIVWGAGSYTIRLLKNSPLGKCNIVAFVDNDTKKQGSLLDNIKICNPVILKKHDGPIVICAVSFSQDIIKQIKNMKMKNRIIAL